MNSILWKALFICAILGGAQWLHTHPDSEATQQVMIFFHQVRVEWDIFLTHFNEVLGKFPAYIHQLLDTAPKPAVPLKNA